MTSVGRDISNQWAEGLKMHRILTSILLLILMACSVVVQAEPKPPMPKANFDLSSWHDIAILDSGRQKPLDTFARETVLLITGKENYGGFDSTELLLSWLTQARLWEQMPIIKIDYRPLIEHLQLPVQDGRIAPQALRSHQEFSLFLEGVSSRSEQGMTLSEMEQAGGRLGKQLREFYQIVEGTSLNVMPRAQGGWDSLAWLAKKYPKISLHNAPPNAEAKVAAGVQGMLTAYHQNDPELFNKLTPLVKKVLRDHGEEVKNYPTLSALQREIHFNQLKPFRLAWIGYALATIILLLSFIKNSRWVYGLGMGVFIASFGIHTYGFLLRMWISGRAPVTNMYETVLWIPFGAVLFALILEAIYRKRVYAIAAGIMATLGLIVAQSAPSVLDPAIDPLVPVLRDNFWLTVHVLTITLSYGAFTLALGVANLNAGFYIFKPQKQDTIRELNLFIYRAIQIGVVLLAAGTILGGVWADQSWGRFWGWDPKEVWALIALLGYLAILHGRYVGWIRGLGMTVSAIVAYLLILMAWYGVNFILGVGLHSYGFSSGGAKFVAVFTGVELIWAALAIFRDRISNLGHRTSG